MYHLYGLSPLVFLSYVVEDNIHYNISSLILKGFKEYGADCIIKKLTDRYEVHYGMVHYGIISRYKKEREYRSLFFGRNEGFYGISNNVFYDGNRDDRRDKLLMLSIGSWNHGEKRYLDTIRGRHKQVLDGLGRSVRENRKNDSGEYIIMFVQNYSKEEYWFGWEEGDMEEWICREMETVREIRRYSARKIKIKFHPKMERQYGEIIKARLRDVVEDVEYVEKEQDLDNLLDDNVYCCVVNSGSVAMEVCMRGVPLFCRDDYYSVIPVHRFGLTDMSKLETFRVEDLPDQRDVLDFICSQCFLREEMRDLILCIENKHVVS